MFSQYFAPRGKERLLFLGEQIAQLHLNYKDRLIGIIGDAGSGKSSLINGMFPGLELSNDDDNLSPQKIMQVRNVFDELPDSTTYHMDMRFQTAFTQMHEIVEFVTKVIESKRRIIIEHFDILYPVLKMNADIMIGIGEVIVVTRPSIFGPSPKNLYDFMHTSLKFRNMAHTAEDVTIELLKTEFGISESLFYSADIRNGFVLRFPKKVELDFDKLADMINKKLAENLPVAYYDEHHIMMGNKIIKCDGPRFHVRNTSEVKDFELIKEFIEDVKNGTYCLVGLLGPHSQNIGDINNLYFPFPESKL